jgi:hypothetical protein
MFIGGWGQEFNKCICALGEHGRVYVDEVFVSVGVPDEVVDKISIPMVKDSGKLLVGQHAINLVIHIPLLIVFPLGKRST